MRRGVEGRMVFLMGLVGFWGKRGGRWGRAYLGSDGGLGVGCDTGVGFGLSGPWEDGRGGGGLMAFYIVNLGMVPV